MFIQYHAADYETASRRARQRWADNIDRLIHGTERKFDLGMLRGRSGGGGAAEQ